MKKDLKGSCTKLIEIIIEETAISRESGLLWIYLNLYYYSKYQQWGSAPYNRERFLEYGLQSNCFSKLVESFSGISETAYVLVEQEILQVFSHFHSESRQYVALKELEEIYENMLQDTIKSKTGSYYTPEILVSAMVINGLSGYLLQENSLDNKLLFQLLQEDQVKPGLLTPELAQQLLDKIQHLKLADIACGGGVFLRVSLEILFCLTKQLYRRLNVTFEPEQVLKAILDKNLYGADIQSASVTLCQLLLFMKQDQLLGRPADNSSRANIFVGDVLYEKNPIHQYSFQLIVGNPPYIGERGNKELFQEIKKTEFGQRYYEGKMDYFYFFIYKAHERLAPNGVLTYITTNYFVTADGAEKLRAFMGQAFSFLFLANLDQVPIFKGAKGQNNLVFVLKKGASPWVRTKLMNLSGKKVSWLALFEGLVSHQEQEPILFQGLSAHENVFDHRGQIVLQKNVQVEALLGKMQGKQLSQLDSWFHVNQGIVSGADRLSSQWAQRLGNKTAGEPIYVLTQDEILNLGLNQKKYEPLIKPFYKNSHISQYYTAGHQGLSILYLEDSLMLDQEQFPELYNHLIRYAPLLKERREVKTGKRKWFALQWPRSKALFEGEKIVVPQRSKENTFAYESRPWYASADVYYLTKKKEGISYLAMTAILNSSIILFWLTFRGKRKGYQLELYSTPLKAIPLPLQLAPSLQERLARLAAQQMDRGKTAKEVCDLQAEINELVASLYGLTKEEENLIKKLLEKGSR